MKEKKLIALRNVITKLVINFAITFSMFALLDIIVASIISSGFGGFFSWIIIIICSLVLSVILYFIFKINKISLLGQIVISYTIVMIGVYLQGYIIRLFTFYDLRFFIICFIISLVGLLILSTILLLKNKKEDDDLNRYLNDYKERGHKWENLNIS